MSTTARARVVTHQDETSVWFWCEGCKTHHRIVTPRWGFNGDVERPTFTPSVLVTYEEGEKFTPKRCHSFVTDGRIQYLDDCTHELKGQTVDLSPIHESMGAES